MTGDRQDGPASLCISLFPLCELVMTDHLGQSKVKLKKLCLYIKIQLQLEKMSSSLGTMVISTTQCGTCSWI